MSIRRISPQAGPQEAFLASPADIVVYGGAAGGGKSYGMLLDACRYIGLPQYNAVIFRRTCPDITNPGGLWDTSLELLPLLGGDPVQHMLTWRLPSGAKIKFAHIQHEKDKYSWQGAQLAYIGFDELTHFSRGMFFYLLSRNRSMSGIKSCVRATCNPDPDSWVLDLIRWWIGEDGIAIPERSGVVRYFVRGEDDGLIWHDSLDEIPQDKRDNAKSLTFISASLADNPALTSKDPGYRASLEAMPRHEREALLGGNWHARLAAGDLFRRAWFHVVDRVPNSGRVVRYWDRAATAVSDSSPDPDWTAGVRMRMLPDGSVYIEDIQRFRGRPEEVRRRIKATASQDGDGVQVWLEEDPGQAGKVEADMLVRELAGYDVRTIRPTGKKEVRAGPLSAQTEHGLVHVVRAEWNEAFFRECEQFPFSGGHDDQVDAAAGAYNVLAQPRKRAGIRVMGAV